MFNLSNTRNLARAYLRNIVFANFSEKHILDTMVATYYVTSMCNFRCSYCEHFSADFNEFVKDKQVSLEGAKRILEVIRKDCDVLYLTGGEPLVRNDIEDIVEYARSLDFAYIGMNTNGLLLPKRERVFEALDNVVISLDSLDATKLDHIWGVGDGTARKVLDIIAQYAPDQKRRKFLLTVNCVVLPDTVDDAERVLEFCHRHNVEFTMSPQNMGVRPAPGLLGNERYLRFVDRIIASKKAGKPISGAISYYESMREFTPFQCYPTLTARVDPEGWVSFPCRPLDDEGLYGGKAGNLLELGSLKKVWEQGKNRWGQKIECHDRCFMRCHAELSLLVKNPRSLAGETISYLVRTIGRSGFAAAGE